MGLVKRTYTIEWDDELGELCLHNAAHVGPDVKLVINDITECSDEFVERAKALLANPKIDEDVIIEAVARWLMAK
jgi:hypothetical protein